MGILHLRCVERRISVHALMRSHFGPVDDHSVVGFEGITRLCELLGAGAEGFGPVSMRGPSYSARNNRNNICRPIPSTSVEIGLGFPGMLRRLQRAQRRQRSHRKAVAHDDTRIQQQHPMRQILLSVPSGHVRLHRGRVIVPECDSVTHAGERRRFSRRSCSS
jgi:hypothetical protein